MWVFKGIKGREGDMGVHVRQFRSMQEVLTSLTRRTASSNAGNTSRLPSRSIKRTWQIQYLANFCDIGTRDKTSRTWSTGHPCQETNNRQGFIIFLDYMSKKFSEPCIESIGWTVLRSMLRLFTKTKQLMEMAEHVLKLKEKMT